MRFWSSEELKENPQVFKGDSFLHAKCGNTHELIEAKNMDGSSDDTLLYYVCGKDTYIAAVHNCWIWGNKV
jgi:hypothetical protein